MSVQSKKSVLVQNIEKPSSRPILKWAGGKQQLWKEISRHIPVTYNKYIEPFFGGGAIFFGLQPNNAIISDTNPELINFYRVVRDNVKELIFSLSSYRNEQEFYYDVRQKDVSKMTEVDRAARMLYLNKTSFNGLYRVNKKGQFNVPFGNYKKPNFCDYDALNNASTLLKGKHILLEDYQNVLKKYAEEGDLVFLDPPYLPISEYSDFKRYTKEFFYEEDHIKLANEVKRLYEMGCNIILTNSNHPLVYSLYKDYKIEIHKTKRYINSDSSKRMGQDVVVLVQPRRKSFKVIKPAVIVNQIDRFPSTRYMGSKNNLLASIKEIANQFKYETVLDAFSGSGVVSYMFKTEGKTVYSNDFMSFAANITKATIENNKITLNKEDIDYLLTPGEGSKFIQDTFRGLYFSDDENRFLDDVLGRIDKLTNKYKKAIATSAICRACLKKRPRGIFTYTGFRYDDGRKDLLKSLKDHFIESINNFNDAVYDNGKKNVSLNSDAMNIKRHADLVYIDPPYYSPLSDNDYTRRYHFIEGMAKRWQGLEIQQHTKTKKFKNYATPFGTKTGAYDAFNKLFSKHKDSIIMVSYSSNALPTMEEMIGLLSKYKDKIEVNQIDHKYSFANQGCKVNNNKNDVQEYIFVGY